MEKRLAQNWPLIGIRPCYEQVLHLKPLQYNTRPKAPGNLQQKIAKITIFKSTEVHFSITKKSLLLLKIDSMNEFYTNISPKGNYLRVGEDSKLRLRFLRITISSYHHPFVISTPKSGDLFWSFINLRFTYLTRTNKMTSK